MSYFACDLSKSETINVVDITENCTSCWQLEEKLREKMPTLCETIKPNIQLLVNLESNKLLTHEEFTLLKKNNGGSDYERNSDILTILRKGQLSRNYPKLLKALQSCGQGHVVDFLEPTGKSISQFGLQWNRSISLIETILTMPALKLHLND